MDIEELIDLLSLNYTNDDEFIIHADILCDLIECYIKVHFGDSLTKMEKVE